VAQIKLNWIKKLNLRKFQKIHRIIGLIIIGLIRARWIKWMGRWWNWFRIKLIGRIIRRIRRY